MSLELTTASAPSGHLMSNERQINVKPEHQNDVKKLVNFANQMDVKHWTSI